MPEAKPRVADVRLLRQGQGNSLPSEVPPTKDRESRPQLANQVLE